MFFHECFELIRGAVADGDGVDVSTKSVNVTFVGAAKLRGIFDERFKDGL